MSAVRTDPRGSRTVPPSRPRPLPLVAAWTGLGAAAACATAAIVVVAISWLPASGVSGHATSAVRAGLLAFLAALHGGLRVDGTPAQFVPLGMTIAVGFAAWRAGGALAAAAGTRNETRPRALMTAGAVQAVTFATCAAVMVPFAHLGSSSASLPAVIAASLLLFLGIGGAALVRACPALSDPVRERMPGIVAPAGRAATGCLAVYAAAGALLVAGSLVLHHARVTELSREVGSGWGGAPVLLLGLLAIPNAVIAAGGYLVGPGFAIGSGTAVSATSTAHGVLPAFPLLGAVPDGHGATPVVWLVIVATPLVAGVLVAGASRRSVGGTWAVAGTAAGMAVAALCGLVWLGGGGIGGGRLAAIGASPWQVPLFAAVELAVVTYGALGVAALWSWWRRRRPDRARVAPQATTVELPRLAVLAGDGGDGETDEVRTRAG